MKGVLLNVLLCLVLVATVCCATPLHTCSWDKRPEELPSTLNSYSFLGFNEEFHAHGEYYVNFKSQYKNIYFNLTQETETRIYVAPHNTWDIDIWLFDESSPNAIKHSSLLIFTDEQIVVTLPPGNYRYHLLFISYSDDDEETPSTDQKCETLVAEFSMLPTQRLRNRVAGQSQQSNIDQIPNAISVYNVNNYNFDLYQTNYTYVISLKDNTSLSFSSQVDFFKKIDINVPSTGSTSKVWNFEATLLSDFLIAGSLGMLLDTQPTSDPVNNLTCSHIRFGQAGEPTCLISSKTQINTNKIKATVPAGSYTLYLFDLYAVENNVTRTFEFQFSLDLTAINSTEDLLTCNAQRIPQSLNTPEYLGDRGFLNFREEVFLDYANDPHFVAFTLNATSYVHFYVAEHRIDIDLALLDSQSKILFSSTRFDGQEESIIAKLSPGAYKLKISYFGSYDVTFCETFDLMMGVMPASYLYNYCAINSPQMVGAGHDNITFSNALYPILTPLASLAESTNKFSYPNTRFVFVMNATWEQRSIFNQSVFLGEPSALRVVVFVNSIVGDLELRITDSRGGVKLATHHRDRLDLIADLEPGTYVLELRTPVTQPSKINEISDEMPRCIVYDFMLDLEPSSSSSQQQKCWDELSITQTLSSVLSLGVANTIHIQDLFLIPDRVKNFFITSEYSTFSVHTPSQFRIYSEPHEVDVDFHLYEGEESVVSSMKDREEEELVYTLKPGMNYTLKVVYFGGSSNHYTDTCMAFNAEIAIAPADTRNVYMRNNLTLPPTDILENKDGHVSISSEYAFLQGSSAFMINIPFDLSREHYFTARVGFDFLWSNLNIKLLAEVEEETSLFSFGSTGYNRNEISTITLPAGSYILQMYEPSVNEDPAAQSFVEFHLDILMEPTELTLNESSGYYSGCGYNDYLPLSLDTLAYLRNPISAGVVQFKQNALVDISAQKIQRKMDFTLYGTSLVRIFVAYTEEVDVDFVISGNETTILRNGVEEESVALTLAAGNYTVLFKFWPQGDRSLSSGGACLSYPVEIGIAPIERVTKSQNAAVCADSLPTSIRLGTVLPLTNYTFVHKPDFSTDIRFNLSEGAKLDLHVRSEFISSGLTFKIRGSEHAQTSTNEAVAVTRYAQLGFNQVYISAILPSGEYIFTLFDPSSFNVSNAACGQFQMAYSFLSLRNSNSTQNPSSSVEDSTTPIEYCTSQTWPVDLYTNIGGSVPYGGPQNSLDSIDFHAEQLTVPSVYNDHKFIRFRATQPSLLRFYSRASSSANDLDFYVYSDVNKSTGSLIGFSNTFGIDESNLIYLPGQSKDYLLDVVIFEYDTQSECNTAALQIAIRRVSEVKERLLCPNNMPAQAGPPTSLLISRNVHINGDYVFTRRTLQQHTEEGWFLYNITLVVEKNTTLTSTIRYDYLTADFQLGLLGDEGQLTLGEVGIEEDSNLNSANNFHSTIEAALNPGTYTLQIRQNNKHVAALLNDTDCVSFSFSFDSSSSGKPHVVSVTPPSEQDHDYKEALRINIEFSDEVDRITDSVGLLSYVNSRNLISLQTTNTEGDAETIQPEIIFWDYSRNNLVAIFAPNGVTTDNHTYTFTPGKNYFLRFDFSSFKSDNVSFTDAERSNFRYTMQECDCNGGTCIQVGSEFVCVNCTFPYAGPHCKDCVEGYHPAAGVCIKNTYCSADTCNGHGWCSDSAGYPECDCNVGYASQGTSFCSICAPGYYGYPNCTALPATAEEKIQCTATVLPKNLNTAAYLGLSTNTIPMHLHDRFFVDFTRGHAETNFMLSTASVFRLYVSPHYVDVDVYLYRIRGSQRLALTNGGLSSGGEEIMFALLEPSTLGDMYEIKFSFYPHLADRNSPCESFGMDLSIVPLNSTKQTIKKWDGICSRDANSVGVYPSFARGVDSTDSSLLHISSDYTFNSSGSTYYVTALQQEKTTYFASSRAYYRWNLTFEISNIPSNQSALLTAELGYRFSVGQLSLALEPGSPTLPCNGGPTSCSVGYNLYNKNVLNLVLSQGVYTLYIYEPVAQNLNLTRCVPFDFSFQVRYIDASDDTFACKGARFPRSLNIPGYINRKGFLHMQDDFILEDGFNNAFFNITEPSYFKISAASLDGLTLGYSATLNVISENGTSSLYNYTYSGQIFEKLPTGNYELRISIFDQYIEGNCNPLSVELLIQPVSMVSLAGYNSYCSPYESLLPHIPENGADVIIPVHHIFPSGQAPYQTTVNSGVVQSWSFITTEPTSIRALLVSDYLLGDLRLELLSSGYTHFVSGDHRYNMIEIEEDLPIGSYTLQISKPEVPSAIADDLATNCTMFEFSLSLDVASEQNRTAFEKCPGDEIPETLDSIRFLNTNDILNFESHNFKIPEEQFTSRKINFMASSPSYFRAYVEPHEVDIDIKLFKNPAVGNPVQVATSLNGIGTEEALVYYVEPDVAYYLQIEFWTWQPENVEECPVFSMQIGLLPNSVISIDNCPGGAEHWPSLPNAFSSPLWRYDSEHPGNDSDTEVAPEKLYLQQQLNIARSKSYTFTIATAMDVYFEVGFDFVLNDLSLSLKHKESGASYYGEGGFNTNTLSVMNLNPGSYTLTIYEPIATHDNIAGCGYFTFFGEVRRSQTETSEYGINLNPEVAVVPANLNVVSYLKYSDDVHIQHNFLMFEPSINQRTITFVPKVRSYLRVSTQRNKDVSLDIDINLYRGGQSIESSPNHLVQIVEANSNYTIEFDRGSLVADSVAYYPVEIAIMSINDANSVGTQLAGVCTSNTVGGIPNNNIYVTDAAQSVYLYNSNFVYLTSNASSVFKINLNIPKQSVVFVQLGYQFLFNDLDMSIRSASLFSYFTWPTLGTHSRNLDTINAILYPGAYVMTVTQSQVLPNFNKCTPLSLTISIVPTTEGIINADCTELEPLPSNLNDNRTAIYGGPINELGSVHITGDSFLVTRHNEIRFTLTQDSGISVFMTKSSNSIAKYSFTLTDVSSGSIIEPSPLYNSWDQVAGIFNVQPYTGGTNYSLTITTDETIEVCPRIALEITIKPRTMIEDSLICDEEKTHTIPSDLYTDSKGIISNYIEGSFSSSSLTPNGINSSYSYGVKFRVQNESDMIASIAFDSLSSYFDLLLVFNGTQTRPEAAVFGLYPYPSDQVNLVRRIETYLSPGEYTLFIIRPPNALPYLNDPSLYGEECYPFIFSFDLVPINTPIAIVSPSILEHVQINTDFTLRVTFNYLPLHKNETWNYGDATDLVKSAFYLQGPSAKVYPILVKNVGFNSWDLVFNRSSLTTAGVYRLTLTPKLLYNYNHDEFYMTNAHQYTFPTSDKDKACNGHGTYQNGYCRCDIGHAGSQCQVCDEANGWFPVNGTSYADPVGLVCHHKQTPPNSNSSSAICKPDTCGCEYGTAGSNCRPLGTCYVVNNEAHCRCKPQYAGSHCETCAEGFTGYPFCTASVCNPPCVHGVCDAQTGKCRCEINWNGSLACDRCSEGWSGPDCTKTQAKGDGGAKTVVWIILGFVLFVVLLGAGFLAFVKWRRWQSSGKYYPLGLRDLKGGTELKAKSSRLGGGDNSVGAELYEIGEDLEAGEGKGSVQVRTVEEDDFNPRAGEPKKEESKVSSTTSSLLDDL